MPSGTISSAKLDADGNIIKPALTFTFDDYYAGTNKKHFISADASEQQIKDFYKNPGSQFSSDCHSLQELTAATLKSHNGTLDVDDRNKLIEMGANPACFQDGNKYLITVNLP